MHRTLLAVGLAFFIAPARAEDDAELARARADFAAIVQYQDLGQHRVGGPSLTSLVRAFLAHGERATTAAEAAAWEASGREDAFASGMRSWIADTIRFLHGLRQRWSGFREIEILSGAVIDRQYSGGGGNHAPALPKSFEKLTEERPHATLPRLDVAGLLAEAAKPDVLNWHEPTWLSLATALGEACALDDAAAAELMKREEIEGSFYAIALGWTRRPDAAVALERRLRGLLKAKPEPRVGYWLRPFDAAAVGLRYADAAAFDRLVTSLPIDQGDLVAATIGGAVLQDRLLSNVRGSTDTKAARLRFCHAVATFGDRVQGPGVVRVLRVLLDAAESGDADLRAAASGAANAAVRALRSDIDNPSRGSLSLEGVTRSETTIRLRWPGEVVDLLRLLVADLEAGRLDAVDQDPDLFAVRPASKDAAAAPVVKGDAAWTPAGIRVRLRNIGATPVAIDAVSWKYADVTEVKESVSVPGEPTRTEHRLEISLGGLGLRAVVPARTFVVLAPDATHEWTLPVREELRNVDAVRITCDGLIKVVGSCGLPAARFATISIP